MRRLLVITGAAFCAGAVLIVPGTASAAPTRVCSVADERLPKISGITAVDGGYLVVDNSGEAQQLRLYRLDGTCKPTRVLNDAGIDPFSPQDLARTPDGVVWVADVGDVAKERATVAVHKVPAGASAGIKLRLTYPDGKHDSAALVMRPNGIPVIITKEAANVAKLYTTAAPLPAAATTVPLQAAGTVAIPASTTPGGPVGPAGRTVVTGAALSPDGKKVLLRTYTDAYEWDVNGGDIVTALKTGKPRHTPLPDEQSGEAITYTADGAGYVTVSATTPSPLLEWTPAPPPETKPAAKPGAAEKSDGGGFSITDLSLRQLGGVVIGVGVIGLLMLVAGIVGIVRFRRSSGDDPDDGKSGGPDRKRPGDGRPAAGTAAEPDPETVMFPKVGGTVYGGPAAASASPAPTSPAPAPPSGAGGRGTVYGASADGGDASDRGGAGGRRATVYGAPSQPTGDDRGKPQPVPSSRGTVYGGTTYGAGGQGGGAQGGGGSGSAGGRGGRDAERDSRNPSPSYGGGRGGSAPAGGSGRGAAPAGGSGRGTAPAGSGGGRAATPASGTGGAVGRGAAPAGGGTSGRAAPPSGGTVYGGQRREPEQPRSSHRDAAPAPNAPDETQQWEPPRRQQRDWRSRQPRD